MTTCQFALVDYVAPTGRAVETTTLLTSFYLVGGVVGAAAGGFVVEHASIRGAFAVTITCAGIASLVAYFRSTALNVEPAGSWRSR